MTDAEQCAATIIDDSYRNNPVRYLLSYVEGIGQTPRSCLETGLVTPDELFTYFKSEEDGDNKRMLKEILQHNVDLPVVQEFFKIYEG